MVDVWASELSRRAFLRAAGGATSLALLSACGGGEGDSGGGEELKWSMWSATEEETRLWRQLAAAVTTEHPDIKVSLLTTTFDAYWDKLQTQLASGTEADIVAMQSLRTPAFAARNALRPLNEFVEKDKEFDFQDFFPVIEEGLSVKDQVYALAYDLGPIILYYNQDLFDRARVDTPSANEPITWDQFLESASRLTDQGTDQYGYVMQPLLDFAVPWLWSGGGDYMNEAQTECLLGSPESISALEFVVGLFTEKKVASPVTDLANPLFAIEAFPSGKVGMHIDGPWQFINVRDRARFNWGVAPFPAGQAGSVTWVAGSGFGISNTTDRPDKAWEALKVITSQKSLERVASSGRGYPARQSAVPAFEDPKAAPEDESLIAAVLDGEIAEVRPFLTTTTWQEIAVMLERDFNPVFLGQQSVQETIDKVVPQFNELLQKHQELLEG